MTKNERIISKEYVSNNPISHNLKIETQHWQLRDMLKIDENGHLIFCNKDRLFKYDTKLKQSKVTLNLNFSPTAITYGYNLTVLGGPVGQVVIQSPFSAYQTESSRTINNGVQVYEHNGTVRYLVCSNDRTVKIYDLETQSLVDCLYHKSSVNNCEVSPDTKQLISVGDTNDVHAFYSEGGTFKENRILKSTRDAGFNVSWNRSGTQFVVSTQDGYACIWDHRIIHKIGTIKSTQNPSSNGAVRLVSFTKDELSDLLLFTEHSSFFNLIDVRKPHIFCENYKNRQTVRVDTTDSEKWISGSVFSPDYTSLFVSREDLVLEYTMLSAERRMFQEASII